MRRWSLSIYMAENSSYITPGGQGKRETHCRTLTRESWLRLPYFKVEFVLRGFCSVAFPLHTPLMAGQSN
ncbi:hypothetical protein CH063_05507 [Colletotrichum higginsianum]|uniref:Uncharacterized protein n=1 Tax=Colletotrichum higginsianum (strain IMI 349063) TaxID=759273 RepID=H1UZ87_COLHI|nr:hypothetical protein CH063_05507 [Colletotrichum higginsianum]